MTQAELIADELDRALRGQAWHGSSLCELLERMSLEVATQRPIPAGHNIWELVMHITSWSNIAARRLTGGRVAPHDGEDWAPAEDMTMERWVAIQSALRQSHENLREIVLGLSDDRLAANAPQSENSVAVMLHGVAQHAAYHGGQIALLKKAVVTQHRRAAL
jgi:uncharacterized damage-inducible protein DinB